MEGRTADKDKLRADADTYRKDYTDLGEVSRAIQNEMDSRKAAAEANANANANASK